MGGDLTEKLDPGRIETRHFPTFWLPPPEQFADPAEQAEWIERMSFIHTDLKWLLSLPVDLFCCQVIFDPSWSPCIDSFLQHTVRCYDLINVPERCKTALSRVSRLFLLALKRVSLFNEDPKLSLSLDIHGEILYNNYLFDAAKLLDICSIFYDNSTHKTDIPVNKLITDIIQAVFTSQPKYFDDLGSALDVVCSTLDTLEKRLAISNGNEAITSGDGESQPIGSVEASDVLLYLYDLSNTLLAFANLFPDGCKSILMSRVVHNIGSVCEHALPHLLSLVKGDELKFKYVCETSINTFAKLMNTVLKNGCLLPLNGNFLAIVNKLESVRIGFNTIEQAKIIDESNVTYTREITQSALIGQSDEATLLQLRELLPDSSNEYLSRCIEEYGPHVDVIMDHVIEGQAEQDLGPPDGKVKVEAEPAVMVPDGDVIVDKEFAERLKSQLFDHSENLKQYEGQFNEYEDEYDDTYDSQNVGADDADSADELQELAERRRFTIPAILRQAGDMSEEEEDDDKSKEKDGKKKAEASAVEVEEDLPEWRKQGFTPTSWEGRMAQSHEGKVNRREAYADRHRNRTAERGGGGNNNRGGGNNRGSRGGNKPSRGGGNNNNAAGGNQGQQGQSRGRGGGRGRSRGGHHNQRAMSDRKRGSGMY